MPGLAELRALTDAGVVADFRCRDGWTRLGERWRGVRLRTLLALEHEGAASPRRDGFPRLVGPADRDCFLSVKSVDRIEVTRQPQRATAASIALARLGSSPAGHVTRKAASGPSLSRDRILAHRDEDRR